MFLLQTYILAFTVIEISWLETGLIFLVQFVNFFNLKIVKFEWIILANLFLFLHPKVLDDILDYYYEIVFKYLNIGQK
jgi:hypothetical protein